MNPQKHEGEAETDHILGAMCGSSDLNERMRAFALSDLRDQEYLAATGTIEAAVDDYIMPKFETEHKRSFQWRNRSQRFRFPVMGLRASHNNRRLLDGRYVLD